MSEQDITREDAVVHRVGRTELRVRIDMALPQEAWEADEQSWVVDELRSKVVAPAVNGYLKSLGWPYLFTVSEG